MYLDIDEVVHKAEDFNNSLRSLQSEFETEYMVYKEYLEVYLDILKQFRKYLNQKIETYE